MNIFVRLAVLSVFAYQLTGCSGSQSIDSASSAATPDSEQVADSVDGSDQDRSGQDTTGQDTTDQADVDDPAPGDDEPTGSAPPTAPPEDEAISFKSLHRPAAQMVEYSGVTISQSALPEISSSITDGSGEIFINAGEAVSRLGEGLDRNLDEVTVRGVLATVGRTTEELGETVSSIGTTVEQLNGLPVFAQLDENSGVLTYVGSSVNKLGLEVTRIGSGLVIVSEDEGGLVNQLSSDLALTTAPIISNVDGHLQKSADALVMTLSTKAKLAKVGNFVLAVNNKLNLGDHTLLSDAQGLVQGVGEIMVGSEGGLSALSDHSLVSLDNLKNGVGGLTAEPDKVSRVADLLRLSPTLGSDDQLSVVVSETLVLVDVNTLSSKAINSLGQGADVLQNSMAIDALAGTLESDSGLNSVLMAVDNKLALSQTLASVSGKLEGNGALNEAVFGLADTLKNDSALSDTVAGITGTLNDSEPLQHTLASVTDTLDQVGGELNGTLVSVNDSLEGSLGQGLASVSGAVGDGLSGDGNNAGLVDAVNGTVNTVADSLLGTGADGTSQLGNVIDAIVEPSSEEEPGGLIDQVDNQLLDRLAGGLL